MIKFCFVIALWLLSSVSHILMAQNTWPVASIPVDLLEEADAVVRLDETYFEIESKSQAKLRRRLIVTVMNERGESNHSQMYVNYDKFTKIVNFEGTLYDQYGKSLKRLKNADISNYGYGAFSDDITDARVKIAEFGKKSDPFPYTIEFSYEIRDRNMMFYPTWSPVNDEFTAVETSEFKVKVPAGMTFRYQALNQVPEVLKSTDKDNAVWYSWAMKNIARVKSEDYALPGMFLYPIVLTAPSEFEIQEYSGNFTNWNDLGKFYYTLNKNRDALPEGTISKVKNLTSNVASNAEKVKLLYEWMQSGTRYVSIQLGIGGWQTIDANTVATKGYGDCKALSNYMIALLKQAGITSYAALIKAGSGKEIVKDFAASQFNHVIVCVPMDNDTIWLECTSQINAVDYLGTFTGNRHALLVTPDGGKLVRTPAYQAEDNSRIRNAQVKINDLGDAEVKVKTVYKGIQQERHSGVIHSSTLEEQQKWLLSNLSLAGADLEHFVFKKMEAPVATIEESLDLRVRQLVTKTGARFFIKPDFLNKEITLKGGSTKRTGDFFLNPEVYSFTDIDSLTFEVPEKYSKESIPGSVKIESEFGIYETEIKEEGSRFHYFRKLSMTGGRFPAENYPAWIDFLRKIRRAERSQIVLIEK